MMLSNPARMARMAVLAVIALVALVGGGCSKKLRSELLPNQAPEVRLTAAPLVNDKSRPDFYAYTIQWVGFDPDGRVDHYVYAVDPDSLEYTPSDTSWHVTNRNEQTFFFSAGEPITGGTPPRPDERDPRAEDPHTFAVYAVDNQGRFSKRPAVRSFWSFTQAPFVNVSDPPPNSSFGLSLTPSVRISWTGTDPDGQFTTKPVRWVFQLFGKINPDFTNIQDFVTFAQLYGDSVRKLYAPDFRGWNHVGADTTSFQYTNLSANKEENPEYLFIVTGFDEAGAYDPIFKTGKNMLRFSVNFASTSGPLIRMFNQFFDYTYPYGGFDESPARWFLLEVPADIPVTFNWSATAALGADIQRYRWGMDIVDLDDESPRRNENDWREPRWSAWSRLVQSATVGPFTNNGETHLFFIEAEDNNDLLSLGIISFTVVRATFDRELVVIDDTRLAPDNDADTPPDGVIDRPIGAWPMAAELDTFLFAKGGVPWRARAPGTLSPPGIFNGYTYDTLGTRGISLDGLVPLSFLGRYRHVIWMIDATAANYTQAPTDQSAPISALRLINSPGRPAILATYMIQGYKTVGGNVWLLGGGAAAATLNPYNNVANGPSTWSREFNELQEGRLMFDYAHWREGIQSLPAVRAFKFGSTTFGQGANRPGRNWPPAPVPSPTPPLPPNYSILPAILSPKSFADDPPPPGREDDPINFYSVSYTAEYITEPSFVREDYNDDPAREDEYSTLDTLYITAGGTAQRNRPVMTYYHGRETQPFVFSGFNIWYWRRVDCIALVDFVLGSVWGLPRDPAAPRGPSAPASRRRAAR